MGGGNNAGMRAARGRYVFLLNSDAWVERRRARAAGRVRRRASRAAVVGPRLRNPDGSLQRSVRGDPTLWRLATEYLFLRKLAPRTDLLNPFYGGGFAHDGRPRSSGCRGPRCSCAARRPTRSASSTRTSSCSARRPTGSTRFRQAGWQVLFFPGAEVVHVGGASHGGRLYVENLRGILRFLAKHRGPREAERARRAPARVAAAARARLPRRARPGLSRRRALPRLRRRAPDAARVIGEYLRLAFATSSCCLPGRLVARALGQRSTSATLAWALRRSSSPGRSCSPSTARSGSRSPSWR